MQHRAGCKPSPPGALAHTLRLPMLLGVVKGRRRGGGVRRRRCPCARPAPSILHLASQALGPNPPLAPSPPLPNLTCSPCSGVQSSSRARPAAPTRTILARRPERGGCTQWPQTPDAGGGMGRGREEERRQKCAGGATRPQAPTLSAPPHPHPAHRARSSAHRCAGRRDRGRHGRRVHVCQAHTLEAMVSAAAEGWGGRERCSGRPRGVWRAGHRRRQRTRLSPAEEGNIGVGIQEHASFAHDGVGQRKHPAR